MRLPEELYDAIQREVKQVDRRELAQASAQLTQQYQTADFASRPLRSEAHRAAYLLARLPATYAVNMRVFAEIQRLAPEAHISSLLDLGTGPGTTLHAAAHVFDSLRYATLIEGDLAWLEQGKRISSESPYEQVRNARWIRHDLRTELPIDRHDLVVVSYTLGELSQPDAEKIVQRAWASTQKFLAVIEPGTRRGFRVIDTARSALIASGAYLLAPCPHSLECPMATAGDWCHFSQRLERSSEHRQLKGGALGYEDEKFSYVVAAREPLAPAKERIVRHPRKHSGHVQLLLCTPRGLEERTITKSQKENYRKARKAEWGDAWE
ncbi:MAG TPA: small ribosomal subunit Rsm22 family protein [Candidatus Angelobacter sp.]|jgi:ribosomal protein RSM22 (predicted rRNA methylase)|nr:small ribosomal subunit Rsm22 family protein [Candidatus Angelobacter sp.]